jgi:hypothetical protein
MKGRIRDKHGIYQSIDLSQNNRNQSINYYQQKSQNSDEIDKIIIEAYEADYLIVLTEQKGDNKLLVLES